MSRKKKPRWLLEDAVIAIHKGLVAEHGGLGEIRDRGLLASALARPLNKLEYADPAPSLPELAAAYAYGLARNHPFADGNKRVALVAAAVFLDLNGLRLEAEESDAVVIFRDLAAGKLSEEELAAWLADHSTAKSRKR